jgi:D-alanyl-D-alanine carboxypeptidase
MAQATGQRAFPLEPKGGDKFIFAAAGVTLQFDPAKNSFTLNQGGSTIIFTKNN